MTNWVIKDGIATIVRKHGTVIIDEEDVDKLTNGYVKICRQSSGYLYVALCVVSCGLIKFNVLSRLIMMPAKDLVVHHINHNTLTRILRYLVLKAIDGHLGLNNIRVLIVGLLVVFLSQGQGMLLHVLGG